MAHTSYDLDNIIKNSEFSYLLAKKMDHGVAFTDSNWKQYEPSKFVYSFFSYNTVYDIDWGETYCTNKIKNLNSPTAKKIEQNLRFIYNNYGDDEENPISNEYVSLLINSKTSIQNIFTIQKDIVDDRNINDEDLSGLSRKNKSIRKNFEFSLLRLQKDKFTLRDHYHLLIFCYQIRNNIFHGTKTIRQMSEEKQKTRLLIYSEILISTLEIFYMQLEERYEYIRISADEFRSTINING